MVRSLLLLPDDSQHRSPALRIALQLALRAKARLHSLTVLDTRKFEDLSHHCETAAYAGIEQTRHRELDLRQRALRSRIARVCRSLGLDHDVRHAAGDPHEVLQLESSYHDLTVVSFSDTVRSSIHGMGLHDLVRLPLRGVRPLLLLQPDQRTVRRVLMPFDGSDASARTIRDYVALKLFPMAEHRLLAVGASEQETLHWLDEMMDYCRRHELEPERGFALGPARKILGRYAHKWQADLLVHPVEPPPLLLPSLLGTPTSRLLRSTGCSAFLSC